MSENIDALKTEMATLEQEFTAYVHQNGFNYSEYLQPPAGSFMEKYQQRMGELAAAVGVKPLHYY
jgi:hypothetical protein